MTELHDVDERNSAAVARFVDLVDELTLDIQREEMLIRLNDRQERGVYLVGPGYDSNPGDIDTLEDGRVRVYDCSSDRSSLYGESGEVIEASTGEMKWRSTDLRRVHGQWRVVLFTTDWDEPCTPLG